MSESVWRRSEWGAVRHTGHAPASIQSESEGEMAPSAEPYARWMRKDELSDYFIHRSLSLEECDHNTGGIPIYNDGTHAYVDSSMNHTLINAMTNSHKTRAFILPMVNMLCQARESMVIHDPKGEILSMMHGRLKEAGYEISVLNLRDLSKSDCWNPLMLPYHLWREGNISKSGEILSDLANTLLPIVNRYDTYWERSGQKVLLGLMYALIERASCEEEVNFMSLFDATTKIMEDSNSIYRFYRSFESGTIMAAQLTAGLINADTTRRCIMSMVYDALAIMLSRDDLTTLISGNDICFETIGIKPTAVFIVTTDEKDTLSMIAGCFISQLNERLIYEAQKLGGRLPVRVNVILDEAASLSRITNLPTMMSGSRSRNIRYTIVIQSISQLEKIYDKSADTIIDNCANLIYLNGRDIDFITKLKELCGYRKDGRPLVTTTQLLHLKKGEEAFVHITGRYPFITKITDISECDIRLTESYVLPLRKTNPEMKLIGRRIFRMLENDNENTHDESVVHDKEDSGDEAISIFTKPDGDDVLIGPSSTYLMADTVCKYVLRHCSAITQFEYSDSSAILEFGEMLKKDILLSNLLDNVYMAVLIDDWEFVLDQYVDNIKDEKHCKRVILKMIKVLMKRLSSNK